MKREKITILNNKNEKLVGELYKNKSKTLIIVCHGLEHINNYPDTALQEIFDGYFVALSKQADASIFSFDFRGHGESEGEKKLTLRERAADIQKVIDHFSPSYSDIILYGFSFGAMSVIIEAARDTRVKKTIIINGFLSFALTELNFILFKNIFLYTLFHPYFISEIFYWNSYFQIKKITIPTLIISVENDAVVGSAQAKNFYKNLRAPKKLVLLPGNDHLLRSEIDTLPRIIGSWVQGQNK